MREMRYKVIADKKAQHYPIVDDAFQVVLKRQLILQVCPEFVINVLA